MHCGDGSPRTIMMDQKTSHPWRINLFFGLLMLALVALCVRHMSLLGAQWNLASQMSHRQERMAVTVPGQPGSIIAYANRAPVQVAVSLQRPSCFVDAKMIPENSLVDVSARIAKALSLDAKAVYEMLLQRRTDRHIWLKQGITDAEEKAVRELKINSIGVQYEWYRKYPNESLASTVLGWTRPNGEPGGGIELSKYSVLAPQDGLEVMRADASRHPYAAVPEETRQAKSGANVYLTIDTVIQGFLEQALAESLNTNKAKWGVGIVVDPKTGDILAMASVVLDPRTKKPMVFNPNNYSEATPEARLNYAITVPYEPGSAAKTIYAAAAVDAGVVDWDTKIFCENGVYHSAHGGTISDHGSHYGWLTVHDGIVFSSNICMGKIGEKCGNDRLYKITRSYNLGMRTGIELSGETSGLVRPYRQWDAYSTLRVPFGQEICTSALQLAMGYCTLANGGELLRPHLISRITDSTGKEVLYDRKREVIRQVLKKTTCDGAMAAMKDVVERGTGKGKCNMEKWTSFGKTGTAQIPSPDHPGYAEGAFTGTFVGGAPASNPEVICLVSIHWPKVGSHFGASCAGPYWKKVVEQTLTYRNVPPDRTPGDAPTASDDGGNDHD